MLVVGKRKDETCGVPIKTLIGLKAKMYIHMTEDEHESKKQKVLITVLLKMNQNMKFTKMFYSVEHI